MPEKSKNKKAKQPQPQTDNDTVMLKPREIIPIMAQTSDPLGSYTGTPAGGQPYEKPIQDADDL